MHGYISKFWCKAKLEFKAVVMWRHCEEAGCISWEEDGVGLRGGGFVRGETRTESGVGAVTCKRVRGKGKAGARAREKARARARARARATATASARLGTGRRAHMEDWRLGQRRGSFMTSLYFVYNTMTHHITMIIKLTPTMEL